MECNDIRKPALSADFSVSPSRQKLSQKYSNEQCDHISGVEGHYTKHAAIARYVSFELLKQDIRLDLHQETERRIKHL